MLEVKVSLTLEEREFVRAAADAITHENRNSRDIPDYDKRRFNLTGKQAGRVGKFAEACAFKWLGGNVLDHSLDEWAHFVPRTHPRYAELVKNQADLNINGLSVEVRRANSLHSPVPVRQKDREAGASFVLQVYVPYKQPLPSKEDPFPTIMVPLHGIILGWAKTTDGGDKPGWAKQAGSLEVPRRDLSTLDLKRWAA